jgi:16S rRNA processing protein RimM
MSTADLVAIARVAKPRGLRGEVAADILTDFPERFEGLENVIGVFPDGERKGLTIEGSWLQNDRVILKFQGHDSPEAANALRNVEICVAEADAVPLEPGEYFDWELVGCRVETISESTLGTVSEVVRTGGTEILLVAGGEKEYMIPFADSICVDVDLENKLIRVDPPEGLLEF